MQAAAEYASTSEGRDRLNDAQDEAASQVRVEDAARIRTAIAKGQALRDTNDQIRRVRESRAAAALAEAEAEADARGHGMSPIRIAEPVDGVLSLEDAKARRGDIHHLLSPIIGDLRLAAAGDELPSMKELAGWAARLRHAMDVADAMVGEEPQRVQMTRFKAELAARQQQGPPAGFSERDVRMNNASGRWEIACDRCAEPRGGSNSAASKDETVVWARAHTCRA